jgi:oligopeptide/dipeptide ABC transporter ATP-binding protein
LPKPAGRIVDGSILFRGENLVGKSNREMRMYRGRKLFMISQDPMTSLNPVFTIRNQVAEAILRRISARRRDLDGKVVELLKMVRISEAESRYAGYPHQFSGGMRQRVMIAMALACRPEILIADEPTTALDVTIQAQVLRLMREVRQQYGMSIILITHDLGVVAQFCEFVLVMYAGRIVERADVRTLFGACRHPYTKALLNSLPRIGLKRDRLTAIQGQPPDLLDLPPGCPFAPRCGSAVDKCAQFFPPLETVSGNHEICCWRWRSL